MTTITHIADITSTPSVTFSDIEQALRGQQVTEGDIMALIDRMEHAGPECLVHFEAVKERLEPVLHAAKAHVTQIDDLTAEVEQLVGFQQAALAASDTVVHALMSSNVIESIMLFVSCINQ